MSQLVKFEVEDLPAMRIVGKAVYPKMDMKENPIPAFWGQCFGDDTFSTLEAQASDVLDASYVGFMCDWSGTGHFTYICGMMMKAGCSVPEGFAYKDCAPAKAAIGWIQGQEKENYDAAHQFTQGEMEKQGYQFDEQAQWCMELYNCPRFTQPMENGDVILDYYIPCTIKG